MKIQLLANGWKKKLSKDLDLTIITPSKWLAGLVSHSILKDYPVKVINNGIDLSVFKPTQRNFRKKYRITNTTPESNDSGVVVVRHEITKF